MLHLYQVYYEFTCVTFISNYAYYGGSGLGTFISNKPLKCDVTWNNLIFDSNSAPMDSDVWIHTYEYINLLYSSNSRKIDSNRTRYAISFNFSEELVYKDIFSWEYGDV